MKLVLVHNHYQLSGGEDLVFHDEARLLETRGHQVHRYTAHNDEVGRRSAWRLTRDAIWNRRTAHEIRSLVMKHAARIVHFHNTFPLISPAAYYGARAGGAAVVQTLHNFRLLCPQATFLREGRVCEECLGRLPWPGVVHGCYRDSRRVTAVAAATLAVHRVARTWRRAVDVYIAVTDFARGKFIEGGLPAEKIVVKPNFGSRTPPTGDGAGGYAAFVGRLSPEKGLSTLLEAWRTLGVLIPLKVVGDGPLAPLVREAAAANRAVEWLGARSADEVQAVVGAATLLVLPSICYEGGVPRVLIEAFALGTPVVASRLGPLPQVVDEGRTGSIFEAGDPASLIDRVSALLAEPHRFRRMRVEARAEFELKYTAQTNYQRLMEIYEHALSGGAVHPPERVESPGEAVCLPNR